jgi:hypothetical protein
MAVGMDAKQEKGPENDKSEASLRVQERTILRGNFTGELLQRREHLAAMQRQQRAEEDQKNQAPGGLLLRGTGGLGRAQQQQQQARGGQSIFAQKGDKTVKSFLDEYLPPRGYSSLSAQEAKEKWKMLSDLDSGKQQGGCRSGGRRH